MSQPYQDEVDISDYSDFQSVYQQSEDALQDIRAHRPDSGAATEVLRGSGEAADGRIHVVVGIGGALESLHIDPTVLRSDPVDVAQFLAGGINAALDVLDSRAEQATPETVDTQAIADQLAEAQDVAVQRMSMFVDGMDDALGKIERAAAREVFRPWGT